MESTLRVGVEPVRLIETLLWDGAAYPRQAGHLARLVRSAAALGFLCDPAAVLAALPRPEGPARVRLTLGAGGDSEVTVAPLPRRAAMAAETCRAAAGSADPWLRVKSTRRGVYDAARAALPPGTEELIFCNERDEVCEGTITNLFFDRGQGCGRRHSARAFCRGAARRTGPAGRAAAAGRSAACAAVGGQCAARAGPRRLAGLTRKILPPTRLQCRARHPAGVDLTRAPVCIGASG
ncbi:aminotransferase class IV [Gemmobacter lanyuensis]